ncbi:Laminin subunit gamma [Fasciolopsis buskii]|uniref:Laminin subunit gamma n=1 Tax=Fasciolopsis buskii TaxID=27845 RepID=A0A8E0RP14_9TREM|nr:Laminin subunit gamma [Fasciolopsis buski]
MADCADFIFLFIISLSLSQGQEPSDTFWVSSECTKSNGRPQMCYPPFTSAAADRTVVATNTCGEKSRQKYCIHMSTSGMASRCQYCDSRNPAESHFPEYMTDKNPNNWWQSETMADNPLLHFEESVNLTVDLGTQFHVNYVYLQFRSPRPHAMVIYKRFDDNSDWTPWAYFSSNCYTYFGMRYSDVPTFSRPDEVICREEYSTLQPLYDGEVIFSVINGRPNYDRFFEDPELQRWSTASQIRVELKKMHTFGDERGAERDTLLTYYFAVQKFTVGGRCLCYGHGNECRKMTGLGTKERLVCVCAPSHHTTGDNCEQCTPDHRDVPWQPATPENPNPCRPCKCNGNSNLCEFDQNLYDQTGSGSRCIGCGNNTEGTNCERCKTGYYPDPIRPTVCHPCACDPVGTVDGQSSTCSSNGQCRCKPGVGGKRCDRCEDNYYGFGAGGCQPCHCNEAGSQYNKAQCDPVSGHCQCKQNVAGRQCEKCALGHYGLMSNDPLGCKPCICSWHSSECSLDTKALAVREPRNDDQLKLASLVEPDKVVFTCPPDQIACDVCLQTDGQKLVVPCNGTREGYLPCLCETDSNRCTFCSVGKRRPQVDPRKETCVCPPRYTGKSCESCAVGYRRDPPSGLVTDRCVECTCNNHATSCHPETGQCDCQDNTGGLFCDRCADGYYGDAFAPVGSKAACKPCPCPSGAKCEQVFWPEKSIEVVCKDCPNNRTGVRCERCAQNFFGDPDKGIPCRPCDCSNNVDPREFENCDRITGDCLKCLFGTTGRHCELCLPGYRRNFKQSNDTGSPNGTLIPARGCSPCYCEPMGTLANYGPEGIGVCNPETGQCPCKPGVGGQRCEECYPGFYGYHSGQGCKPCDCDSIGAIGEACDDRSGHCKCRPFIIGRQCDKCQAGYFNMTSTYGCQDCKCDPYGSESIQCDERGRCKCRSFAVGNKCDRCQENHYNLAAGCLPCPACYNLVQARVTKLWGMLESVFGPLRPDSKPGSTIGPDDKDLQMEIIKLNNTVVTLYRSVLEIGIHSSDYIPQREITWFEEIKRSTESCSRTVGKTTGRSPRCNSVNADEVIDRLQEEVDHALPILLTSDVTDTIKQLRERISLNDTDKELTETANDVAELIRRLEKRSDSLKIKTEKVKQLLVNGTERADDAEGAMKHLKSSLQITQQRSETLDTEGERMKGQIEATDELIQKVNNQVYQARSGVGQIPDLRKEIRLLESVMSKWQEANQTSQQLQTRMTKTSADLKNIMDRLRQTNSQLRDVLNERQIQAKQVQQPFIDLENLEKRVLQAQNLTWDAFIKAENKLTRLQDFENYVAKTKALVPDAIATKAKLETRLAVVQANVKDLRNQAKQELLRAYDLKNQTDDLQQALAALKTMIVNANARKALLKERLDDLRSRHEVDVRPEVKKAAEAADGVDERAKRVVETVSTAQLEVIKMNDDVADLLKRMKKLKDQLTESVNGGSSIPVNGEDAAVRFAKLKGTLEKLRIQARLDKLRELNQSRTIELSYLRHELAEFKAHYDHLVSVGQLLPLKELNCFYTGKEIEGDQKNIGRL